MKRAAAFFSIALMLLSSSALANSPAMNSPCLDKKAGDVAGSPDAPLVCDGKAWTKLVDAKTTAIVRLDKNAIAPFGCDARHEGTVVYTGGTTHTLCFCNGSAWGQVAAPATACAW